MKVFHIVSNKVWGGGEQYVYDLCQHLIADGNEVMVICRSVPVIINRYNSLGIPTKILPLRGIVDIISVIQMTYILKNCGSCIVHVHNFKDAFTAAFSRKISGNDTCQIIMTRHLVKPAKKNILYNWLYKQIDSLIVISSIVKDTLLSNRPSIPEDKIKLIPNSVYINAPQKNFCLKEIIGVKENTTILMYHGRLSPEKGLDVLFDAISKIKKTTQPFCLVVVGHGEDKYVQDLKKKSDSLGITPLVHILGFKKDISDYINQADIGIIPSTWQEPFSLACLEYMALGKCVITTNNGGQKDFIKDGVNGFLVPPSNSDMLANVIANTINKKSIREDIGKKAIQDYSNSWSYPIFFNNIKKIYSDLT